MSLPHHLTAQPASLHTLPLKIRVDKHCLLVLWICLFSNQLVVRPRINWTT